MKQLTEQELNHFGNASHQIYEYYCMAYGRQALGYFMEAIEENPELTLKEIYDLMYEEPEEEEEDDD